MLQLPPLSPLRSFEAAGRLKSFSKAADELGLTHGAVSRAISTLEDALQVQLFEREGRSVKLTQTGTDYYYVVRESLQRLATATSQLLDRSNTSVLTISTLDSFAATWLLPRLFRFSLLHKEIDVRLSANEQLVNFTTDGIDLAIRYGAGHYEGLASELLLREVVTPVCSPKLLAHGPPLNSLSDLRHYPLIHDDFAIDWATWLRAAGVTDVEARRGPHISSSAMVVTAAVEGHGIILGRSAMVADELRAGRLVQPFAFSMAADYAYYIVYPPDTLHKRKVRVFRDWLLAEAAQSSKT